ncbi:MAG: tripartite tricarboxylate transporter TctB family protein [Rhodospirillales bacterium]|nr:MAG: tripartite tricarboxylate transporter TctB family protein [Rhodospirillales bacterium]
MPDSPQSGERAAKQRFAARIPGDAIAGAAVLAFCFAAYLVTLTFREAPAAIAQNVQPATFPRMVLAVMAVLAGVIIFQSFRTADKKRKPLKPMVWFSALVMPGFVIAFYLLGILPAMTLLCLGLPVLWGERRFAIIVPYSIVFPVAIYLLFAVVLKVHFEPSPLAFWR